MHTTISLQPTIYLKISLELTIHLLTFCKISQCLVEIAGADRGEGETCLMVLVPALEMDLVSVPVLGMDLDRGLEKEEEHRESLSDTLYIQ